jgi:LmbE family N-acetylglucosaminyl deacetylase
MVPCGGAERPRERLMETCGGRGPAVTRAGKTSGGLAVAVSPHLDDAVFSVGGTVAALVAAGWRVRVVTCFTASVADPSPFALSTQLDKGLGRDVDYMALRRAEDTAALAHLGAEPVHLPLPEAPHRGYTSAPDLFAGHHPDDAVAGPLAEALAPLLRDADRVLAPQAIGDHVDHRVVAEVVAGLVPEALFWRDAPYVLRRPDAAAWRAVPDGPEVPVDIGPYGAMKAAAACCYATQLGFQFGGPDRVADALDALARSEAARVGAPWPCEVLRGTVRPARAAAWPGRPAAR